jgi:hypothetical protein
MKKQNRHSRTINVLFFVTAGLLYVFARAEGHGLYEVLLVGVLCGICAMRYICMAIEDNTEETRASREALQSIGIELEDINEARENKEEHADKD